jgi:hypothetical protein
MVIRRATYEDIDELMKVFEGAKQIMRSCGNLHQWKEGYPSVDILHKDIESGHCFIACEDNKILATMALIPGPDPTYAYIEGRWPDDDPYYVIHRIATSAPGQNMATKMFDWAFDEICKKGISVIRIDTHRDNCIMKHVLTKYGFHECGVIYLANGDPRDAYVMKKDTGILINNIDSN